MHSTHHTGVSHAYGSSQKLVNVGDYERMFSAAAGAGLAAYGLLEAKRGGLLMAALGGALVYRGLSGSCQMYKALGISTAEHHNESVIPAQAGVKVEQSINVQRSPAELYSFWREVENLPKIMRHVEKVEPIDRNRSHWTAKAFLGKKVEWDAEIFNDVENEMIAWRSLPNSEVDTAGSVHFRPNAQGGGTTVVVSMKYNPPAGKLGDWVAALAGSNLEKKVEEDLRNFKRTIESGEHDAVARPTQSSSTSAVSPTSPQSRVGGP